MKNETSTNQSAIKQIMNNIFNSIFIGAVAHLHCGSRMENFSALDPRKQELLEARLLGNNNRVSKSIQRFIFIYRSFIAISLVKLKKRHLFFSEGFVVRNERSYMQEEIIGKV